MHTPLPAGQRRTERDRLVCSAHYLPLFVGVSSFCDLDFRKMLGLVSQCRYLYLLDPVERFWPEEPRSFEVEAAFSDAISALMEWLNSPPTLSMSAASSSTAASNGFGVVRGEEKLLSLNRLTNDELRMVHYMASRVPSSTTCTQPLHCVCSSRLQGLVTSKTPLRYRLWALGYHESLCAVEGAGGQPWTGATNDSTGETLYISARYNGSYYEYYWWTATSASKSTDPCISLC